MIRRTLTTAGLAVLAAGVLAVPAHASQAITDFSVTTTDTQAGGHPDLTMSVELDSPGAPEAAKDITIVTPEGLFGNPNATPRCNATDFALEQCPSSSQAGLVEIHANYTAFGGTANELLGTAAIYGLEPAVGQTALFGFIVPKLGIPIQIPIAVQTAEDFQLRFTVAGLTQLAPLARAELTYWGFPAEEANDGLRFPKGATGCPDTVIFDPAGGDGVADPGCLDGAETRAATSVRPLIDNPFTCTGEDLDATARVSTYQDPGNPSTATAPYPQTTGCFSMAFKPTLGGTPTSTAADSPAGLDLVLNAFQTLGRAPTNSPIKKAELTLPEGLTINPDAADGQRACEDSDVNFNTEGPAECPDNAKIGTFAVGSPALDGDLKGSIYIGEPQENQQYRLFLIASGFGINAKFEATFDPDPDTGQVSAEIDNLPQVPFDRFELHLFAGDRALMATPTRCSLYPIVARYFPWNDFLADVVSTQFFSIDSGPNGGPCPGATRPFEPRLKAGNSNPTAGAFSDFHLQLDRDDGDQFLDKLGFTMPPGFTGSLRGISYCPESALRSAASKSGRSEQASPSCPASSQIGTTNVAAGPGGYPFNVEGRIYLSGPLNGAPLSLAAITPALAGPYDYGTQVVRVGVFVDQLTARVHADSDPMPQIIGGVPLRMRTIRVNLNRDRFLINPTNCSNFEVESRGTGDQGTEASFASPFHAVNCFSLPFRPKMRVRQLGGRKKTRRSANPPLLFDLWTGRGHANLRRAVVILPNHFQIDQSHLGNICSEAELLAKDCEGRQPIGVAMTRTPLLDEPLRGRVYAVSGSGGLPRLAFILEGQVRIVPRADTTTTRGDRLKTVVPVIPDAPVGHFRFRLFGGRVGYLVNNRSLCRGKRPPVVIRYLGHNNKRINQVARLQRACGKRGKGRKRGARRASVSRAVAVSELHR